MRIRTLVPIVATGITIIAASGCAGQGADDSANRDAESPATPSSMEPTASAQWVAPKTAKGLIYESNAIVEARVESVRSGPSLAVRRPASISEQEMPDIPTQRIDVTVQRTFAGKVPGAVTLFRTGGKDSNGRTFTLDGDPPFEVGERYVLFLERRNSDGTYLYFGPSGRYQVEANGRLKAFEDGHIPERFADLTVGAFADTIADIRSQDAYKDPLSRGGG
jgi:hypothetical protein